LEELPDVPEKHHQDRPQDDKRPDLALQGFDEVSVYQRAHKRSPPLTPTESTIASMDSAWHIGAQKQAAHVSPGPPNQL
jgi:hypothetical protein